MILYHATFRKHLPQIIKYGLGARQPKNWEISEKGYIYFSQNYNEAYDFCEAAEDVKDDTYASGIVVLAIDTATIKLSNLQIDENVKSGTPTYKYKGTIACQKLREVQTFGFGKTYKEQYIALK